MRRAAVAREAWRNVLSGTSRAGLLALVLIGIAVGCQLADLLAVRSITQQVDEFRASGADTLVYTSTGRIDPGRCELLAEQPHVIAAGAVRRDQELYAAALPASSIPSYAVTPGFPGVLLNSSAPLGAGVVLSRDLAETVDRDAGSTLALVGGVAPVAAVYDYPQDGRAVGFGYALLTPTSDPAPFDACWVREWPMTDTTEMLLRGVGVAGEPVADAPAPDLSQLNTTLGRRLDAPALYADRPTRWAPLGALLLAAAVGFAATRLRRLEIASARHLGVTTAAQVLGVALEAVAWAVPVVLVAAVSAALVAANGHAGDVAETLALGALAPAAVVIGGGVGAAAAVTTIREGQLLRYLKER